MDIIKVEKKYFLGFNTVCRCLNKKNIFQPLNFLSLLNTKPFIVPWIISEKNFFSVNVR